MVLKIGIFDSGLGGLSLLRELQQLIPSAEYFYIADQANAPYGEKSPEFILKRCQELTESLLEKEVNMVVVGCNTATAEGINWLRARFSIPFVGIEPYLNIINQREFSKAEDLAVLTTTATLKSTRFVELKKRLDPEGKISTYASSELAALIELSLERGEWDSQIATELKMLQGKGHTHLILGCTHYPLIEEIISQQLKVTCISPGREVANRVLEVLADKLPQGGALEGSLSFMSTRDMNWGRLPQWPLLNF